MPTKPTIACIDDDPFVREALEGLLQSIGYTVLLFASAEEFLQSSALLQLSCLITDMKLGGMSGLQLLRQLAHDGHSIPTIVVTAFGDDQMRDQSLAAGAIGFLNKPIHEADLLALLKAATDRNSP
ncbi:response regulator transcription factor [Sphingomonas sanxanigenens]|uniref:Response regulatory domain-containing protein n=1 Tax=Sphingomonas sanxanigenens DSM 19645 = NX02 TaxID=1123269 RepID=W0A6S7_9SPHN|nr:response regulator [Sphingomonas sanxanigenens]AHE52791.1 hypothetical protein NX02_05255 [Sphingomonas sanxanigenens DSM 19645 = NX02]